MLPRGAWEQVVEEKVLCTHLLLAVVVSVAVVVEVQLMPQKTGQWCRVKTPSVLFSKQSGNVILVPQPGASDTP